MSPRGCDGKSLIVQTVFLDTISSDEYNPLALSRDTLKVRHSLDNTRIEEMGATGYTSEVRSDPALVLAITYLLL